MRPEPILTETMRNLYDGVPIDEVHKAAILALPESAWEGAIRQDAGEREGAWVSELCDLDLSGCRPDRGRSVAASAPTRAPSSPSATPMATASK